VEGRVTRHTHQAEPGIWITDIELRDFDVRGVLIAGDSRAAVWDTLSHPLDMSPVASLAGDRDLVVVYSHADWDHVWGTAGLGAHVSTIVAHRRCLERFAADVPNALHEKQRAEPGRWDAVELVPPAVVFDDRHTIDLGGLTLELFHLPGHTPDEIVGFVPERGLLLMGDAAETPFPVVPADAPLDGWIAELQRWADDPRVRVVMPAHGAIGGREVLRQDIDYLTALRDGRPFCPAGPLPPFYRETHAANQRWRR
jgi:glyoxylase-like metal-dependent hydrolase (beta-lactamase superfamily II)